MLVSSFTHLLVWLFVSGLLDNSMKENPHAVICLAFLFNMLLACFNFYSEIKKVHCIYAASVAPSKDPSFYAVAWY